VYYGDFRLETIGQWRRLVNNLGNSACKLFQTVRPKFLSLKTVIPIYRDLYKENKTLNIGDFPTSMPRIVHTGVAPLSLRC